jgi:hypothetical protein
VNLIKKIKKSNKNCEKIEILSKNSCFFYTFVKKNKQKFNTPISSIEKKFSFFAVFCDFLVDNVSTMYYNL